MSSYVQAIRSSILPLSMGGTLPEVFAEWRFSGESIDHEEPVETCQLCSKDRLRYHFRIDNPFTANHLWVGSHCILQFDLPVFERGRRLTSQEAKAHLATLQRQMRLESCLRALEKLAHTEDNDILSGALNYYRRKKKLTPRYAAVVFWKLEQYGVDHDPSFFAIELRRDKHVADLEAMLTQRVHYFWKALTPAQRRRAQELGHSPPLPLPPRPDRAPVWPLPSKTSPQSK